MSTSIRNRTRRNFAPIFAALGDETRLHIVRKLANGKPASIAELTEGTGHTRQAVTKHLVVLENARIVRGVRAGREKQFQLDPTPIRSVAEYADIVSREWDKALARLKEYVER